MENVSIFISILFLLTVVVTVGLFFKATHYSKAIIIVVAAWILLQCILGIFGFYTNWTAIPPRFPLLIVPPVVIILVLLVTREGKALIDSWNIETLTILHTIRIPVEITLYFLLIAKLIPPSMTFEGSNFDIISGLTAPVVYYLGFVRKKMDSRILLIWNLICLVLLLNVVITALLSAKTPFQKLAFDQPNIGVTYFPFLLLPAIVVPIVLLSHLVSMRQLIRRNSAVMSSVGALKG